MLPETTRCRIAGCFAKTSAMIRYLSNLLILQPSRNRLDAGGKRCQLLPWRGNTLELWTQNTVSQAGATQPDVFILKFGGAAGRAERATMHPADTWPELACEVATLNPPGFGGSGGRPSMFHLAEVAEVAFAEIQRRAAGRPIFLTGNSLGTTMVLHLAVHHDCAGLIIRNPPPLAELLYGRFGWWNLNYGARMFARRLPPELNSIENARRVHKPCVFLMSGKDRVVPPRFQHQIIDAYAGEKQVQLLAGADHMDIGQEHERDGYRQKLRWLLAQAELPQPAIVAK